ncbi:hypothetical protein Patl1_04962 [Pistacia atlantica]|uniref:Uncharacterized protein n=1 Tax=Pistacia atlantica TaxID=434234 RepID=A0ACC1BRY9_9ROSI|nr:hypothetical protein Patl1_04962 [Pistacia atlantica]
MFLVFQNWPRRLWKLSLPDIYVQNKTPLISDADLISEIPVINMQKLISEESMDSELNKLHFACKEWGFFQLVNHGVSSSILEKVKKEIQEFFNLNMEEKKRYWQYPGRSRRIWASFCCV